MTDHQCTRSEDIATIKTTVSHLTAATREHHKTLYGNGRKGLDDRMTEAEAYIMQAKNSSQELKSIRNQLIITIIGAVVAAWIIGATIGCTSTRSLSVNAAGVTAQVQESASTNWNVGDLSMTAAHSADADGSTTSTATVTATKNSMNSIVTGSLAYAAGIITALAGLGL